MCFCRNCRNYIPATLYSKGAPKAKTCAKRQAVVYCKKRLKKPGKNPIATASLHHIHRKATATTWRCGPCKAIIKPSQTRRTCKMSLAENLQFLRAREGVTQEQLAERLNVSRQSVSKWESGVSQTKGY